MLRRPPRSTRTDTLFPYTNALPIFLMRRNGPVAAFERPGDVRFLSPPTLQPESPHSLSRHDLGGWPSRSEEHTSELQSLMRISYAVFCLKKKNQQLSRTQQ